MVAETAPQILHDLQDARQSILAKRERLLTDYKERLAGIDALEEQIRNGDLEGRDASVALRQIVSGGGLSHPLLRIGRFGGKTDPSIAKAATQRSLLEQCRHVLKEAESHAVGLIFKSDGDDALERRLQASLLIELIQGFEPIRDSFPSDPVLRDSIREHLERTQQILEAIAQKQSARWGYYLEHTRFLMTQLSTQGLSTGDLKSKWKSVDPSGGESLSSKVLPLFSEIQGLWRSCFGSQKLPLYYSLLMSEH